MTLLLAAKKLSHSLQFPTSRLRLILLPFPRFSTVTDQPRDPPFMAQYLISSFGFSPDRAVSVASSRLTAIKSPERPEAVVRFLKETGLTDSQVKSLIYWSPQLLRCNISNTLEPHVRRLVAGGFTGKTLTRLIQACPSVLVLNSAASRLLFWRDYVGNDDALLKIMQKSRRLLQLDIDDVVIPSMNILKDYGLSDVDIRRLYLSGLGQKLRSPDCITKLIKETEAYGFDRKSSMFPRGLIAVGNHKTDTIMRKLEFFRKSYGWSDEEVYNAFIRFPNLVAQSEKTLKSKMDFLLGSAGLTNQNIISSPSLIGYSLERRLVPRYHVLNVLKINGLKKGTRSGVIQISEKNFLNKFIMPYKKEVPELEEVYAACCQQKMAV